MFKSTVFSLAHSISYLIYKKEKAMPTYQLQIKQIVDYPRCRIYQQFIRFLMEDRSIRVNVDVTFTKENTSARMGAMPMRTDTMEKGCLSTIRISPA